MDAEEIRLALVELNQIADRIRLKTLTGVTYYNRNAESPLQKELDEKVRELESKLPGLEVTWFGEYIGIIPSTRRKTNKLEQK